MRPKIIITIIITALAVVGVMVWQAASARETADQWPAAPEAHAAAVEPGDGTWASAEGVDRGDPDAVARAVAEASTQFDTVTDTTQSDALLRAGHLLTDEVRAANAPPERNAAGAEWIAASEHDAYAAPLAEQIEAHYAHEGHDHAPGGHTAGEVEPYIFDVSYKWQGRDGKVLDGGQRTVLLSLDEIDGAWTVTEFYVQPVVEQIE